MDAKRGYTLHDFTEHARNRYPEAYKVIANKEQFKFAHLDTKSDLLQIAFWHARQNNTPAWARVQKNEVEYLYGKLGNKIVLVDGPLFPHKKRSQFVSFLEPFSPIIARIRRRDSASTVKLLEDRLKLAVKFAFLITGRLSQISCHDGENLLEDFESMCTAMPKCKDDASAKEPTTVPATRKRRAIKQEEQDEVMQFERDTSEMRNISVRHSKRVAVDRNQAAVEPEVQRDYRRVALTSPSDEGSSATLEAVPDSPYTARPSDLANSLVQTCMEEAELRYESEKASHQTEIFELLGYIATQKQKVREAKTKLDESNAAFERQVSVIAGLEGQVRDLKVRLEEIEEQSGEWKNKYEKLENKRQAFLRDG